MKSRFVLFTSLVLAVLLLAGCTISITTKVNADGSGEMGFAYKFTKSDLDSLASFGMKADTICSDMTSQGGSSLDLQGMELKQEKHGDETWCVGTKPFKTLDELKTGDSTSGFTINRLEIKDNKLYFDAVMSAGSDTQGMESMPFEINIGYEFTAPGKVTKHNGDKIDGNTVTWNIPLTGEKSMQLESDLKGGGSSDFLKKYGLYIGIGVACLCLLVIIVIVVFFFVLKKKPTTQTPGAV